MGLPIKVLETHSVYFDFAEPDTPRSGRTYYRLGDGKTTVMPDRLVVQWQNTGDGWVIDQMNVQGRICLKAGGIGNLRTVFIRPEHLEQHTPELLRLVYDNQPK